jgi:hypothetical protein
MMSISIVKTVKKFKKVNKRYIIDNMRVNNSVISKVFRQIAFLTEFEAKGNENIDNEYKGKTGKNAEK